MNDQQKPDPRAVAFMEMLMKNCGADCPDAAPGDYKDEEGLLVCHVCGERKESRQDVPFLGVRVHKRMCACGRKEFEAQDRLKRIKKQQERVDELKQYSIIDKKFRESTFSAFHVNQHNQKAFTIAKRYVDIFDEMKRRGKGLLLYGNTGTGKSFLSACIANALMTREMPVPVIFTSIIKLTSSNSPFSKNEERKQMMLNAMNSADLLIIDDYGAERGTDFKMEQVFEIIDSRYNSGLPMIITTNFMLEEMMDEPDIRRKRIFDRIQECCFPVKFTGPSWRREIAADDYDEIKSMLLG